MLNGEIGVISSSLRNNQINLISGDEILGDYLVSKDAINIIGAMGMDDELVNKIKKYGMGDTTRYYSSLHINNLEIIWHALEFKYKDSSIVKGLMEQFVNMYIFTILLGDADKHPGNWFIMENSGEVKLAPLFDNGNILIGYEEGNNINEITMSFSTNFKDYEKNLFKSFEEFFNISSVEYLDLFEDMFNRLFMNFDVVLENTEKQIATIIPEEEKEKIICSFNEHCMKILNIIDEFKRKKYK